METKSSNNGGKICLYCFLVVAAILGVIAFVLSLTRKCTESFDKPLKSKFNTPLKAKFTGNVPFHNISKSEYCGYGPLEDCINNRKDKSCCKGYNFKICQHMLADHYNDTNNTQKDWRDSFNEYMRNYCLTNKGAPECKCICSCDDLNYDHTAQQLKAQICPNNS